jgi:HNH endonuclease
MTTEQRFWKKVRKTGTCWIWTASKRNKGYGAFSYTREGKLIQDRAHRFSWEIHHGPIPEGLCVLHNCPGGDNPACVNPDHLYLGTKAMNNADTITKGRYNHARKRGNCGGGYPRGEAHPAAILSEADVCSIRSARKAGESFGSISRRLSLSIGHVFRIVTGKAWSHVQ